MRPFVIVVVATLALPASYVLFIVGAILWRLIVPVNPWDTEDCSNVDRASIVSPDGMHEAKVVDFDCGSPLSGQLKFFTAIAIVSPGKDPSRSAIALEIKQEGDKWRTFQWQSDIVWESPSQLQITLPESVELYDLKSRVGMVRVEVTRVPDRVAASPAL